VRLDTEFDRSVARLPVPALLTRGDDPALCLVDGLVRGVALPGRFQHSPGLFGLRVEPAERVAVTVTLGFDAGTVSWWRERVPAGADAAMAATPRVLIVRAQGRDRGAVLLARPGRDPRTATFSFEIDGSEVYPDGMLVFEAADMRARRPEWLSAVTAPYAAVGVTVTRVEVAASADADAGRGGRTLPAGLLLANPGGPTAWRIRLATTASPAARASQPSASSSSVTRIPPAPSVGSPIPHGRPLPPPEPRTRVGRWASGMRSRLAAEGRLNEQGGDLRSERPNLEVSGQLQQDRGSAGPGRRALDPAAVLDDLVAVLVRERRLRIRSVGLYTGSGSDLPAVLGDDGDLEVSLAGPLTEPVVIRLEAVEDEDLMAPELRRRDVAWHVVA
jgi:hypothetical protein